jgi:hypothetical protein
MRDEPEKTGGRCSILLVNDIPNGQSRAVHVGGDRTFVKSNRGVKMGTGAEDSDYEFIERVLRAQGYGRLKKTAKGTIRRFLAKVTALSRAQMTRLIRAGRKRGAWNARPHTSAELSTALQPG